MTKLSTSTAHHLRSVPILALVAALLRLNARRAEQMKLPIGKSR